MFEEFLTPVNPLDVAPEALVNAWALVHRTAFHDPELPELLPADLALIGVPDFRGAGRDTDEGLVGPDRIRRALYGLAASDHALQMVDLGNIRPGASRSDTLAALKRIMQELLAREILPIVIGGSQDLALAQYEAYLERRKPINLVSIDGLVDVIDILANPNEAEVTSESGTAMDERFLPDRRWLLDLFDREDSWLYNFTQLAYQSHYVPPAVINTLDKLHFERVRLGEVRENLRNAEPAVRDADLISFDLGAIRAADAPATLRPMPNGLFGEEACQIMRYAGISDKLSAAGIWGYDPSKDQNGLTAELVAQMIWYFIDGFYHRRGDRPDSNASDFTKFIISIEESGHDLIFWKSDRTGRWWMQVPFVDEELKEHQHLVPCSYEEYTKALERQEVPDRFIRASNRLG